VESIFWDLVTSGSGEGPDKNQPTSTSTSMFLEAFASTFTAIFTTAVSEMVENRLFLDVLLLAHANINLPKSRLLQPEPFLSIAGVSPVPCSGP